MMSGGQGAALETVIIFTTRMETLGDFYQTGLGLGPFNHSPGHIGMDIGPVYLGFDQVEEARGTGGATMWFTVDDLEATFERFVGLGATVRYGPTHKPWGAYLAALYDLDGNMFGLSQREG